MPNRFDGGDESRVQALMAEVEHLRQRNTELKEALEKIADNEFVTVPFGEYRRAASSQEIAREVLDA